MQGFYRAVETKGRDRITLEFMENNNVNVFDEITVTYPPGFNRKITNVPKKMTVAEFVDSVVGIPGASSEYELWENNEKYKDPSKPIQTVLFARFLPTLIEIKKKGKKI